MLQCLDFSWTWARILNWPLMNFQLDNWQNAAHERVWGHPRGARELEHATRARAATSSPIPISSSVPNETLTSIACPFAASDWLSLFLSLSLFCSPYYTVLNANKISNIQIFQFMHKKEIGLRLLQTITSCSDSSRDNTFTAQRDLLIGVVDVRLLFFLIGISTAPTRFAYLITISSRVIPYEIPDS